MSMENKDYKDTPEVELPVLRFDSIHEVHIPVSDDDRVLETSSSVKHQHKNSVSISNKSMRRTLKRVEEDPFCDVITSSKSGHGTAPTISHSQPLLPTGSEYASNPAVNRLKDRRYDSMKTWSGKLERQFTNFRGKSVRVQEPPPENNNVLPSAEAGGLTVDRYFDALEGPELDTLKDSEESVLPADKKWPFLLRFQVSSFGICLGVSSQAIMWKALASSKSTNFLHISPTITVVLWSICVALVAIISAIYLLKLVLYFEAVRREYYHPIRVNFFFAPWIALLFLALGAPHSIAKTFHKSLWYVLMTPILVLDVKIYGQWMSGGQRRLSKVANPSNHLAVVGNFVGALLGASMGIEEGPVFFFAIGLAHFIVLFVTLYQRLPTNETLPKDLHPVFFLFVAGPSVASTAWAKMQGSFDDGARMAYFIGLFLYFSLAVRVNFFRGFKFSLAWWAYTTPMTSAAITTISYSNEVTNAVTQTLSVTLSVIATVVVISLLITTIWHAFVLRNLFPNDNAIAISNRKPKTSKHWRPHFHFRHGSPNAGEIENYLKFSYPDEKDLEAALKPPVDPISTNNMGDGKVESK